LQLAFPFRAWGQTARWLSPEATLPLDEPSAFAGAAGVMAAQASEAVKTSAMRLRAWGTGWPGYG
jgi:hypothetical protein